MQRDEISLVQQWRQVGVAGSVGDAGEPGPAPISIDVLLKTAGDQVVGSGTWTAITELTHTVTVASGNRLLLSCAIVYLHAATSTVGVGFKVDSDTIVVTGFRSLAWADTISILAWITGLSVGVHTVTPFMHNDWSSITVFGGTSTDFGVLRRSYSQLAVFAS